MKAPSRGRAELLLLALLALLWGSSYLFIKIAVVEVPPLTLIAARVFGAAIFLNIVLLFRGERFPTTPRTLAMLGIQSVFNSIGAWTILAWGQQFVTVGLASVLNSTSPIFVVVITALFTRHEALCSRKLLGTFIGILGVALVLGSATLRGLGEQVIGQLACLAGAALYAGAAIYGTRITNISVTAAATGTMTWASVALVPAALAFDKPWNLAPNFRAVAAIVALSVLCTGVALLIYFRLVHTLGSLGVASQSYLRAGIGVLLGLVFLGEKPSVAVLIGFTATVLGVALINWPSRLSRVGRPPLAIRSGASRQNPGT